jgi:hypothetical protein
VVKFLSHIRVHSRPFSVGFYLRKSAFICG